jgi:uncharacterized membrane protein YbhN (UPF0104 family)
MMGIDFSSIPWKQMWLEPRKTIRHVLDTNPNKNVVLLGLIYGLLFVLSKVVEEPERIIVLSDPLVLGVVIIFAPIMGVIYVHILGGLTTLTGKLLGGKGTWKELTSACAYSQIVFFSVVIFDALILAVFAMIYFSGLKGILTNPIFQIIDILSSIISIILSIIAFLIFLIAISEAHKFSIWKAFLSTLLLGIGIVIIIAIVVLLLVPKI